MPFAATGVPAPRRVSRTRQGVTGVEARGGLGPLEGADVAAHARGPRRAPGIHRGGAAGERPVDRRAPGEERDRLHEPAVVRERAEERVGDRRGRRRSSRRCRRSRFRCGYSITSPPFVICGEPTSQFFPMFHGLPPFAAVLWATIEARIVTFEAGAAIVMPPPGPARVVVT